jgi:hypothetical protein
VLLDLDDNLLTRHDGRDSRAERPEPVRRLEQAVDLVSR